MTEELPDTSGMNTSLWLGIVSFPVTLIAVAIDKAYTRLTPDPPSFCIFFLMTAGILGPLCCVSAALNGPCSKVRVICRYGIIAWMLLWALVSVW